VADHRAEQHKIEQLKTLLARDPNDEVALFGLGKAYLKVKNYEEAIRALERCIQVKPDYSAAYQAITVALYKAGQIDRSIEVGRKGIEISQAKGDLMVTKQLQHFLGQIE